MIKKYLITLITFLAIDFLWLGFIANSFYAQNLGYIMRDDFLMLPAVFFYLVYSLGILVFAVNEKSLKKAVLKGAFLGFIAYAAYDLTNFATLKDWPIIVVLVDILWGTFLTGMVSFVSYKLAAK